MFHHLHGGRPRTAAASPATFASSVALHLIVLAGAIRFSMPPTYVPPPEAELEVFTMISLPQIEASSVGPVDAPTEAPTAVQAPAEVSETAADPTGEDIPFEIPPVDAFLSPFSSVRAPPHPGGGDSSPSAGALLLDSVVVLAHGSPYRFDYDGVEPVLPPTIRDRRAISDMLANMYPRNLRYARISGSVTLRFVVDERGRVEPGTIRLLAADRDEFAMVAMRVIRWFEFSPARYRGEAVPMMIELPISWVAPGR
jgi:TonB family protein